MKRNGILKGLFVLMIFVSWAPFEIAAYPDLPEGKRSVTGPVARLKITENSFPFQSDIPTGDKTMRLEQERDPSTGAVIREKLYDESGVFQWESVNTYDEEGKLIEQSTYDKEGRLKWRNMYEHSDEGQVEKKIQMSGAEQIEATMIYRYSDDRLEEESMYNAAGALQWSKKYTYYSDRDVECSTYYPDGSRIKTIREVYNSTGLIIREVHTDELGSVFEDAHFVYDSGNRLTELRVYDGFGRLRELRLREYNRYGNMIREVKDFPFEKRVAEYRYGYTYDTNANWTERTVDYYVSYDGDDMDPVSRTEILRTIEYASEEE
ncbi:MAG: hypothetical protein ACLFRY_00090 [Spirochaetia bacterium]